MNPNPVFKVMPFFDAEISHMATDTAIIIIESE